MRKLYKFWREGAAVYHIVFGKSGWAGATVVPTSLPW
jgi:hypothetical protein